MKPLPLAGAAVLAVVLIVRHRRGRSSRWELGGGALAIAALLAYGLGLVKPPDLEQLLVDIGEALGPRTYILVGALAFLETAAFVGLLVPGETAILVGGLVAGQGEIDIVVLIAITWACAFSGDIVSYTLGRRLGRDFLLLHGQRVKITEARFKRVEDLFESHGGKAILVGRYVGLLRAILPFVAGSSGMKARRFLAIDFVASGVWVATFAVLGYVFWQSFDRLATWVGRGTLALGIAVAVVAGLWWAWHNRRELRDRLRRRRQAR